METSRDDVGIAIRSAFLAKGIKQRFYLISLIFISILFLFAESLDIKPLNFTRNLVKDIIYRGSLVIAAPSKGISGIFSDIQEHLNVYENYDKLKKENSSLKSAISKNDFLELENNQLRRLIEEQVSSSSNMVSARVMLDKQSPYLNSFIINIGSNKNIKNGMAVLNGDNFIGRVVDVNFFSSRVLLIADLNSKIPVITEPTGFHGILSGHGSKNPTLEFLPENHKINNGDKIYTSGKEGIFSPGIPIGEAKIIDNIVEVILFSDLDQITFVNIKLESEIIN